MEKINFEEGMANALGIENFDGTTAEMGMQEIVGENEENYFSGIIDSEVSSLDLENMESHEDGEEALQKAIDSILELEEDMRMDGKETIGANGKETFYKCDICRKNVNVKMLEKHMVNHKKREQRGELKCKFCGRRFVKLHVMFRHEMSHRQNIFLCQECGRPFYRKDVYEVHVRTHTGEKPHQCPICKNRYNDPSNLRKHMYCHETHKNYSCELCDEVFNTYGTWKKHHRLHAGLENFKCSVCSKLFFRWEKLKDHEVSVHNITTRERQKDKRKNMPKVDKPKKNQKRKKPKENKDSKLANTVETHSKYSRPRKSKNKNRSTGVISTKAETTKELSTSESISTPENSNGDKENDSQDLICIRIPSPILNASLIDSDNCQTIEFKDKEDDDDSVLQPISPIVVSTYANIEIDDCPEENTVILPLSPIPISAIPYTCPICGEEFPSQDHWETHLILAHGDNKADNQLHDSMTNQIQNFTCWICGVDIQVVPDNSCVPSDMLASTFSRFNGPNGVLAFQSGLRECSKCKTAKSCKKLGQTSLTPRKAS